MVLVDSPNHTWPPLQGVNSALEDVVYLNQVLEECGDNLEVALPLFESRRMPDVRALVRIMQFGFPYQVSRPGELLLLK